MRSLCSTRAPTVSVVVGPPGGVASLPGLTAVEVPICCAMTCFTITGAAVSAVASANAMDLYFPSHCSPQNRINGPALIDRSRYENAATLEAAFRYCSSEPIANWRQIGTAPFGGVRGGERRNERIRRTVSPGRHAGGRNDRPRPHSAPGGEPGQPD